MRQRQQARILVVDDDRLMREIVTDALVRLGNVENCDGVEAAVAALEREPADLVISDLVMPGHSGLELLEFVRREHVETDFVLLTANASVESAVEALRMGATDYLTKPVQPEELALVVDRILATRRLRAENARLRDQLETLDACQSLMSCLDAGQVFAVALDLLLSAVGAERGIAVFRRPGLPTADGVAFRGFGEAEARRLRDVLVVEKSLGLEAYEAPQRVGHGVLHDALRSVGVACPTVLAVPLRGRETEQGLIWIFEPEGGFSAVADGHAQLVRERAELALQNAERYRPSEGTRLHRRRDRGLQRALPAAGDRARDRACRALRPRALGTVPRSRSLQAGERSLWPPGGLVGAAPIVARAPRLHPLGGYPGALRRRRVHDPAGRHRSRAGWAKDVAERIRSTVSSMPFEGGAGAPIPLSISIGVATFPLHGRNREQLLDAADKAMYRAKSNGRNCVASLRRRPRLVRRASDGVLTPTRLGTFRQRPVSTLSLTGAAATQIRPDLAPLFQFAQESPVSPRVRISSTRKESCAAAHAPAEVTAALVDSEVVLAGWVHRSAATTAA